MMTAPTILLVEDDDDIAEPLLFGLRSEGYRALHAPDGPRGLEMARAAAPDAILLDVMLPGMDGFTVCRLLRQESAVPILMLTARGQEVDRVTGLELGADDYIVKPFSFRELVARVRAMLRRRELDRDAGSPVSHLNVGSIAVDRAARRAWQGERALDLTPREFDLLAALARQAGQAVARQELLDLVWGVDWIGDPRTLDVHIRWLREKIEDDPSAPRFIQTVRGYGYRLVDPEATNGAIRPSP